MRILVIGLLALSLGGCTMLQPQPRYQPNPGPASHVQPGDIVWNSQRSTGPTQGARHISKCPQPIIDTAFTNGANLANLQPGMDKPQVYRVMGIPQRATSVRLTDNRLFEVLYYLTGAPECVGAADVPMVGDFIPVVFNAGQMIGYGQIFYDTQVAPRMFQAVPTPVSLHPNTPLAPTQPWR